MLNNSALTQRSTDERILEDIKGYENPYQVSSFGNIRSLKRNTTNGKTLSFGHNNDGYRQVCLYKNGKKKTHIVSRLVAINFIENEKNYLEVNHIDKNVKNNNISNLEWCDRKYNVRYSKSKKIIGIKGNEKIEYDCLYDSRLDGFNYGNIWRSIKKGGKHKGYEWKYI